MVGFHPESHKLTPTEYAVAGAASGVFTRAFIQPFDVIKIRFQLQVEPIDHTRGSKYWGILQAYQTILREEGVPALWKGHVPAQLLSSIYGVVQFVTFELLTKKVWEHLPDHFTITLRPLSHFACGGLAGSFATLVCHPFDVIRTRFIAQGEPKVYTSIMGAANLMVHQEGVRSLYKGLLPALLAIGPQTGFQFGFYAAFTRLWEKHIHRSPTKHPGAIESLVCGSGAGFGAKLAVYPLDLTKKRLQVQGFERGRKGFGRMQEYKGLANCMRTIVTDEGFRGLYKGLTPSLLKAVVSAACIFFSYEQCCNVIRYAQHT